METNFDNFIETSKEAHKNRHKPYYEVKGRAHDMLLRCADCKKLVKYEEASIKGGCTNCGNRRLTEIRSLTVWEWAKIRLGIIQFEDRKGFLREFSRRGV